MRSQRISVHSSNALFGSAAPAPAGLLALFISLSASSGCSKDVGVGSFQDDPSGAGGSGGEAGSGGDGSGGGGAGGGPAGAVVAIHMRATTEPVAHDDSLSGQTPIEHRSGIRKFSLLKDASDTSPFTVFDFGEKWVEVGFNDGDDTLIYETPAASLPQGTYTLARVVHSHVRYRVKATMHYSGFAVPGEFDNMQVLSDGTLIDGALRDHGYFEYAFKAGAMEFPLTGDDAPSPEFESGGFYVKFEDGEWASYFPVNLPLTPSVASDVRVVLLVNMHESFRWEDQAEQNYKPKVFDTTPSVFEPVKKFGPSSFTVLLE
jgi:hypothetical protein